ncbi:hypothetical protein FCJ60_28190 [Burkholderia metallica]|nr:hypothetical protein [Burkholderia metallica]
MCGGGATRTGEGSGRETASAIGGDTRMPASRQPGRLGTEVTVHQLLPRTPVLQDGEERSAAV